MKSPRPKYKGKLSHKHLYLLRGRALAAMGRYKEAAGWLTHPGELPFQKFHGASQLLQSDAIMYDVVHEIVTRDRDCKAATATAPMLSRLQQHNYCHHQQRAKHAAANGDENKDSDILMKVCQVPTRTTNTIATTTTPATTKQTSNNKGVLVPTDKKLWAHLLYSVDQRLTRGAEHVVPGVAVASGHGHGHGLLATPRTGNSGKAVTTPTTTASSSSSAIYQMLRHGPVLFYHFEEEPSTVTRIATDAP